MSKETEVAPIGESSRTNRGFEKVVFKDEYGKACYIQESSRAVCENDDGTVDDPLGWIWMGIENAEPKIMKRDALKLGMPLPPGEVTGWTSFPIPDEVLLTTQMHLNEKQVRGLIARLNIWLETGRITQD
jgi:hypothetical protein